MNPSDQQNQQYGQGAPQGYAPPQQIPVPQTPYYPDPTQQPQQVDPYHIPNQRVNGVPDAQQPGVVPAAGAPVGPAKAPPPPKPKTNPNSTQNNLQIAEIRDGIVIMDDGSFRAVVMLKSINFDLMSPQEREGVEFSYQGFLNSLYFPVQIFVRSKKIDIKPYLDKLDKIRSEHDNMLLALLMEDYLDYVDGLASQTNIMDKKFYVTIPFNPKTEAKTNKQKKAGPSSKSMLDGLFNLMGNKNTHVVINEKELEDAKDELRNRVQTVLGGLLQCGVQGLPLDTQELIELYYDTYNPDTATRQKLKNFDDLQVPIITKGEGQAPQPTLDRTMY